MRERLIELLEEEKAFSRYMTDDERREKLADYLLANGVIVPPCKVGDTVYFNHAELDETCPAKVIEILNNYYTPSMPIWITIEYESKLIGKQTVKMWGDVFKLVCHRSKEEAEQALRKEKR